MSDTTDPTFDSINAALNEWAAAELAGDRDRLDALLTDDFVGIGPLGFSLTKPEWIGRHEQILRYRVFTVEEAQIRRYGEVAVVIARDNQHGTALGHPVPQALRATHVLLHQNDTWRMAVLQLSFIAGTPGAPPSPGAPPAPGAPARDSTHDT